MRRTSFLLLMVLALLGTDVPAAEPPRVATFSPQGTVKHVTQVRVAFSDPMVPFGDPSSAGDPFAIECAEAGRGRWLDPRTWVYDFDRQVPGGTACGFQLRPGTRALSGRDVQGKRDFRFATGGPAVVTSLPFEGHRSISEDQVFILTLDAAPDDASVTAYAGVAVPGLKDRIGLRILQGAEREQILAAQPWLLEREPDPQRHVLVQALQRLPVKARVSLVWGKGIRSLTGVATERDQVLTFETRAAFLAEFSCERESPRAGCIPVLPMTLRFNAPLAAPAGAEAVLKGPSGRTWRAAVTSDGAVTFDGPFPEKAELRLEIPRELRDDAGRPLLNADKFPLRVRTGPYPPLAKFSARFGIVEASDPVLPVTVRNLEPRPAARVLAAAPDAAPGGALAGKVLAIQAAQADQAQGWLRRVAAAARETSLLREAAGAGSITLPAPQGASALEVIGIPLPGPGLYIVEIESALLGRSLLSPPKPMFVPAAALVTNLAVHLKRGRESSLVWVTTLDRAEPVGGAAVAVTDCEGRVLWEGETGADGVARIERTLPADRGLPSCPCEPDGHDYPQLSALRGLDGGLFVTARLGADMSFVHSSWDQGIEAWRFRLPGESAVGPVAAHSVFDRSLLRAGETLHMKHFIRRHTRAGFAAVDPAGLPDTVSLQHRGSRRSFTLPLIWDAAGTAESAWPIPREAPLGEYEVTLQRARDGERPADSTVEDPDDEEAADGEPGRWRAGRFRVEEFRVPLLQAVVQPPAALPVRPREVALDLAVRYLAGGGAAGLPVKVRSEAAPRAIPAVEGFEEFVFANGGVREGTVRRGDPDDPAVAPQRVTLPAQELTLDPAGTGRAVLGDLPVVDTPLDLTAEMEFRDPSGEVQTVAARVPLWNAGVLAGIRPESGSTTAERLAFDAAVVDPAGRSVAGAPVTVEIYERVVMSHRKRLAGGFYAYEHAVATRRVGTLVEGRTDARGLLHCELRPPVTGEVILVVASRDAEGNRSLAHRSVWVADRQGWWFEADNHDRMDLLPERKRYEPGDTAVFQVRMPFDEATALVTVEREGIMESRVETITRREPVVRIPVAGHHAPNVFVSVLAVRGRVAGAIPTAMVDLGKPAFKLGTAEIRVGWRAHELKVSVAADRPAYQVRDTARIRVRAVAADGQPPPAGAEVALAAVDEGLLELMPNRSWDLLAAMMGRRGCEVRTATAQMQVVGKRHFGVKALPQGGGGGRQATRELFDTLLAWQARVPLDAHGEATVEVPLNDSITAFRIVAVASAGADLFGTGETTIRSGRELMVFAGLPPLVRTGDRFRAMVTVRNASPEAMTVEARPVASDIVPAPDPQTVVLRPGEARELGWQVTVPPGIERLSWEFETLARETGDRDRLRVVQTVIPAVPPRVVQGVLERIAPAVGLPIERPAGALPAGGVKVQLRPRLAEGLDGVADYMRAYPHGCLEQKVSVAVALRDAARWERLASDLPAYADGDGLLKYFPASATGDPVLTAYVVAVTHEAGWRLPDGVLGPAAAGLRRFVEGSLQRRAPLPTADLTLRKLAAIGALARVGRAEPKLLGSVTVEPDLWPTSAVIDWIDILLHLENVPDRAQQLAQAEQALRTRVVYQGAAVGFSSSASDRLWWLMVSTDVNAARTLLTALRLDGWRAELPQLVRGLIARQVRGHWDLTTANAWGVLALQRFSRDHEQEPVTGATQLGWDGRSQRVDWERSPAGEGVLFPWAEGPSELTATHAGNGRPWLSVQSIAAVPRVAELSAGYRIRRTIAAVSRRVPDRWSRGDVLRVRLELEAQADMTWVAVTDPVPAGATVLGSGLGRDSQLLSRTEARGGGVRPAWEERAFDAFRAYYEILPRGTWSLEYTVRLNQDGTFLLPPTRVEALYAPEVFGERPNESLGIDP
jgi:alpha-2-macroglobulin